MTQNAENQGVNPPGSDQAPSNQQQQQQNGAHPPGNQQQGSNSLQPVGQGGRGGGRPWAGQRVTLPPPVADVGDGRIVLLFDLNGVLTEKTPPRVEGKFIKRDHIVRPHVEELLRLHPHFRIGVYSSATIRTVNTALDTLYAHLQRNAAQRGIDGLLLPRKFDLFNAIYYRDHCQPDPYWRKREDGKDHDTIKPLSKHGFDLSRVVLVDNDDYKAADGEHENMLHVPHWEQTQETDRDFPLMIQLILRHLKGVEGDVRPHLRLIERQLRQLRSTDDARLKTAADRARTRAVTAATAQKWVGDDSVREVLAAEEVPAPDTSAATAAAVGLSGAEQFSCGPQIQQKMRQFALQGLKASSADELAEAPPAAKQLVQLLNQHRADSAAAAAAAVDVQQLLADADDELKEAHSQHSLVLLLATVWGCNVTVPTGVFTLAQVSNLLKSRGWPTAHLVAAVETMIRAGVIKVLERPQRQQQQQQQQQQQWVWPEPPGVWPAPAAAVPAAAAGAQQQQQQQGEELPAWADCLLLLPDVRVNKLMKSVNEVTSCLATATPAAVTEVLKTLEYNCQLLTVPKEQHKQIQQQQRQLVAGKATQEERNRVGAVANAWSVMINAAVRDVVSGYGVTAQQLLRFIRGLHPALQQQLLGSSSSNQQQQQRLEELLQQLEGVVKEVPVRIKDKRQKSLLGPPFGVFAVNKLFLFKHQTGGDAANNVHSDPAAAAALTTYTVGCVPNAEAVARSIRVLAAAAAASDTAAVAAAVEAAKREQQQQLDRHVQQQGGQPQHSAVHQLKPPVVACLTLSQHLSLPAVVVQWLVQCEQLKLLQQPGAADSDAAAAAGGGQDSKRPRESEDGSAAAAAAAEPADGSASKRQKRGQGAADEEANALHLDALPRAAAAGGSSRGQDAVMTEAAASEQEADLDALYDAEEQRRQHIAALEAEEDAIAAAELAALDAADPAAENTTAGQPSGFERGSSPQQGANGTGEEFDPAAAAAAEGSDVELLLQEDESDGDDEGLGEDEDEEGLGGDDGQDHDNNDDDDDDMGFDGAAAAADGGGSSDAEGGDGYGVGSEGGNAGSDADQDGAAAGGAGSGSEGPDDGLDWEDQDEEFSQDREDGCEFQGEYGSEDDSQGWATDDEADGQLQLGITGLEENLEADTTAAAAADDEAAEAAAAAETAAAMQRSRAAAAAAAGQQIRGRLPLYSKLVAALATARGANSSSAAAAAGSSSCSQQQQPSRLHFELLRFAAAAAPCAVERLFVEKALQQLHAAADGLWGDAKPEALLFGSQATGLALPGSDLDVVLLRVPGCPLPNKTDKGFGLKDKKRVGQLLGTYAKRLRSEGYANKKGLQIIVAKVPILKGTLFVHIPQNELLAALATDSPAAAQQLAAAAAVGGNGKQRMLRVKMQVDISIGIADSSAAVSYVQRQVRSLAPMRPLLLAAKAVLREAGLNEVFTGGLGSYALALLVISHLQAEGVADLATSAMLPADRSSISHQAGISQHLQQLAAAAAAAAAAGSSDARQQQQQQWDLGLLLQGFFLRFGALFDYKTEAVVVNQGGVLAKPRQWVKDNRPFLLSVEDPAMPGRDMSSGSYAIRDVKSAFTRAAGTLRELTTKLESQQQSAAAGGGALMQENVAAAAAAAVLAAMAPAGSNAQPPQRQQQQRQNGRVAFEVVEDRAAWAAVQADGASQSFGNNVNNVMSAMTNGSSSSSPAAGGLAAAVASREQQLTQGLKQGFGMLGQLMDVVVALGRGAAADAHRSESARQAALRGQARLMAQKLQYEQQFGNGAISDKQQAAAHLNQKLSKSEQKRRNKLKLDICKQHKLKQAHKQPKHHQQQQQPKSGRKPLSAGRKAQKRQQQQQGGPQNKRQKQQGGQQQQQGGGQQRPLTRAQLRALQGKLKQRQQQQQYAPRQQRQKQQQAGKKRPRDGGAAAGGGGRGWGY